MKQNHGKPKILHHDPWQNPTSQGVLFLNAKKIPNPNRLWFYFNCVCHASGGYSAQHVIIQLLNADVRKQW